MRVKLNNIEVLELSNEITKLLSSTENMSLKTVYKMDKNLKAMASIRESVSKLRDEHLKKGYDEGLLTIDEDGLVKFTSPTTSTTETQNSIQKLLDELNELFAVENEIEIETFSIDEIGELKISNNKRLFLKFIND